MVGKWAPAAGFRNVYLAQHRVLEDVTVHACVSGSVYPDLSVPGMLIIFCTLTRKFR